MEEGENVWLILGLTIQVKSTWMGFKSIFRKNYAYGAAPSNFRKHILYLQANREYRCACLWGWWFLGFICSCVTLMSL